MHLLLKLGFLILVFYLWGSPYERGFFCDDESLKHPYKDSTVTNVMLYIVGLGLPVFTCEHQPLIKTQRHINLLTNVDDPRKSTKFLVISPVYYR
ncbi:putative phosphatidate phosphatase, partial [Operophtera brumata]